MIFDYGTRGSTGGASGTGRWIEQTGSGAGVRDFVRDGSQDAALFDSAELRPAAADTATEAGAWIGIIDQILGRK